MKRIFIAVKVDPGKDLMQMISTFKSALGGDNIKWINPDNIHITLAFLGDTEDVMIKAISVMLAEKCGSFGRFELTIRGSGVFKNLSDPRIIWSGIEPSKELVNLNGMIKRGLTNIGIKIEDRPFRPHLTLGRIKYLKSYNGLEELIDRYKDIELQKIYVSEVVLFESILLQTGPLYKEIEKFIL